MTVKLNMDTSSGAIITSDTSGILDIQSAGTTKMTIGSTIDIQGNELVLDADADTSIHASTDDQIDFKIGGNDNIELNNLGASRLLKVYKGGGDELVLQSNAPDASGNMRKIELEGEQVIFSTGASSGTSTTQRHIIDEEGQFLFGGITDELTNNGGCLQLKSRTGSEHCATFRNGHSDGGFGINFQRVDGTQVGSIAWTSSATNFNTSSDYRLKENVTYTFDATTEIKKLKPCKFNFKDESDTVEGFLAHEVSSIVPLAVTGTKDAKDSNDNPIYQSIDQSKLVPLLVKTIQELEARITALESE